MALGKPSEEFYLLHVLHMAKAMQYLTAMAMQNGAKMIWQDEADFLEPEKFFDRARAILNFLTDKGHGI